MTEEGKKYPLNNAGNQRSTLKFPAQSVLFNMPDQTIEPQDMSEGNIYTKLITPVIIQNGKNSNEFVLEGEWRYSQNKLDEIVEGNESIIISKIPFRPNHVKEGGEIKKMHNLLTIKHYNIQTNEDADAEQSSLFGASYFDYAKPTGLIKLLTKALMYNDDNGIILDFFAGSATTAHAVMQLNSEDGANRRHISVQLPEVTDEKSDAFKAGHKNIADISKERIRRAAKKVKEENPLFSGDLGFKVFKLDTSNIKTWESGFDTLKDDLIAAADYIKQDRSSDDIVFELLLKYGLDLTVPIETRMIAGKKVYSIGLGALVVCLDNDVPMETVNGIGALKEELKPEIMRVVFKDSGFKDDVVKTNALQTLKRFGIDDIKSL